MPRFFLLFLAFALGAEAMNRRNRREKGRNPTENDRRKKNWRYSPKTDSEEEEGESDYEYDEDDSLYDREIRNDQRDYGRQYMWQHMDREGLIGEMQLMQKQHNALQARLKKLQRNQQRKKVEKVKLDKKKAEAQIADEAENVRQWKAKYKQIKRELRKNGGKKKESVKHDPDSSIPKSYKPKSPKFITSDTLIMTKAAAALNKVLQINKCNDRFTLDEKKTMRERIKRRYKDFPETGILDFEIIAEEVVVEALRIIRGATKSTKRKYYDIEGNEYSTKEEAETAWKRKGKEQEPWDAWNKLQEKLGIQKKLKTVTITRSNLANKAKECKICYGEFLSKEHPFTPVTTIVETAHCEKRHEFDLYCKSCMEYWLKAKNVCPICKKKDPGMKIVVVKG